jgi:RHS repeat-associated protein
MQLKIKCYINHQKHEIVESYRYSVFGEEEIINERGRVIADSAVGNPWRYLGNRVDKETELIYFAQRYHDPRTGRWISPDPAGNLDGPNLYAFARNNPLTYIDYFGLASERERFDDRCCGKIASISNGSSRRLDDGYAVH